MVLKRLIGCLAISTWVGLAAHPALALDLPIADRLRPNGLLPNAADRQSTMSPSEAARIAQHRNGGGRVLAVDRGDDGYRVKLLKNGDVRIVLVPNR